MTRRRRSPSPSANKRRPSRGPGMNNCGPPGLVLGSLPHASFSCPGPADTVRPAVPASSPNEQNPAEGTCRCRMRDKARPGCDKTPASRKRGQRAILPPDQAPRPGRDAHCPRLAGTSSRWLADVQLTKHDEASRGAEIYQEIPYSLPFSSLQLTRMAWARRPILRHGAPTTASLVCRAPAASPDMMHHLVPPSRP
jgi:hypothetical protein